MPIEAGKHEKMAAMLKDANGWIPLQEAREQHAGVARSMQDAAIRKDLSDPRWRFRAPGAVPASNADA
jgi:hypothetical protein